MNLCKFARQTCLRRSGTPPRFGRWKLSLSHQINIAPAPLLPRRPNTVDRLGSRVLTSLMDRFVWVQQMQHAPYRKLPIGRHITRSDQKSPLTTERMFYDNTSYVMGCNTSLIEARMAAPFFLAPLLAFLKSGSALKTFSVVSRVAFAIAAPLRLRSKQFLRFWHGADFKLHEGPRDHSDASDDVLSEVGARRSSWRHPHFRRTTMIIIGIPIVLFIAGIVASLERTPIWGRWRVIMISDDEEAMLIEELLRPGTYQPAAPLPTQEEPASTSVKHTHTISTTPRDWIAILHVICGDDTQQSEECTGPQVLLGGIVLDPRTDWRARWVQDVLIRLEDNVWKCGFSVDESTRKRTAEKALDQSDQSSIPPVEYPLSVRPALLQGCEEDNGEPVSGDRLVTRYGCVVLDAPVCNAFSIGFGPALSDKDLLPSAQEAPGVVVVYTGLLDEIVPAFQNSSQPPPPPPPPPALGIFGLFGRSTATTQSSPVTPQPTTQQTEQLAVTLAHEISHLLLSHSLESWTSQSVYDILTEVVTDMTRTILYPLTAFLGPVFNDWFGRQVKANARLGLTLASSCESRKAEIEADLLALRLLHAAGFNPCAALDVWGPNGMFHRVEQKEIEEREKTMKEKKELGEDEGESWLARGGFLKSHPPTAERHRRIVEELKRWGMIGERAG